MDNIQHGESGFSLTLGEYTLSVQYGVCNYCSRRDYSVGRWEPENPRDIQSTDCEIALFRENKMLPLSEHDRVYGWLDVKHLPKVISLVADQCYTGLCIFLESLEKE